MKKKRLLTDRTNGLEDAIASDMAKQVQEEIDWGIECTILTEIGYKHIKMSWFDKMNEVEAHKISQWCKNNIKGKYKGRGKDWLFENKKDAANFILRWT